MAQNHGDMRQRYKSTSLSIISQTVSTTLTPYKKEVNTHLANFFKSRGSDETRGFKVYVMLEAYPEPKTLLFKIITMFWKKRKRKGKAVAAALSKVQVLSVNGDRNFKSCMKAATTYSSLTTDDGQPAIQGKN